MSRRVRSVARAVLEAARPVWKIRLAGEDLRVCPDSRGAREEPDYAFQHRIARGKRCVLDVGANRGMVSLLFGRAVGEAGQVWAVEASEHACVTLRRNLELNGMTGRVRVVNAVAAERSGEVVDFFWAWSSGGASTVRGHLGHTDALPKVSLSLDDLAEQRGLRPDLVKVDVEGAERVVLAGAERLLRDARPTVVVEVHTLSDAPVEENARRTMELPLALGYRVVDPVAGRELDGWGSLAGRGRTHLLLLPPGEATPPWLSELRWRA